jgi:hypothetical protein
VIGEFYEERLWKIDGIVLGTSGFTKRQSTLDRRGNTATYQVSGKELVNIETITEEKIGNDMCRIPTKN